MALGRTRCCGGRGRRRSPRIARLGRPEAGRPHRARRTFGAATGGRSARPVTSTLGASRRRVQRGQTLQRRLDVPPWLMAFFRAARSLAEQRLQPAPHRFVVGRLCALPGGSDPAPRTSRCALWKRCAGSRASARMHDRVQPAGTSGRRLLGGSMRRERTASMVRASVWPSNSARPVRHSHSTMPRQKTSVAAIDGARPRAARARNSRTCP